MCLTTRIYLSRLGYPHNLLTTSLSNNSSSSRTNNWILSCIKTKFVQRSGCPQSTQQVRMLTLWATAWVWVKMLRMIPWWDILTAIWCKRPTLRVSHWAMRCIMTTIWPIKQPSGTILARITTISHPRGANSPKTIRIWPWTNSFHGRHHRVETWPLSKRKSSILIAKEEWGKPNSYIHWARHKP